MNGLKQTKQMDRGKEKWRASELERERERGREEGDRMNEHITIASEHPSFSGSSSSRGWAVIPALGFLRYPCICPRNSPLCFN